MEYRIWYSSKELAKFLEENTILEDKSVRTNKIYPSDATNPENFHKIPDHIKEILYLDSPDAIIEVNQKPILSLEVSTEAGTGHNAFQRFARIAASVENNVPAFYIYPEATIVERSDSIRWDRINPLVFRALDKVMDTHEIPALLFYFPGDYREFSDEPQSSPHFNKKGLKFDDNFPICPDVQAEEMQKLFECINALCKSVEEHGIIEGRKKAFGKQIINEKRYWTRDEYHKKTENGHQWSPLTSTEVIPTQALLDYLNQYKNNSFGVGELIKSREKTLIYKINAKFRGDPYPGALAAIDYLKCRTGKTSEERSKNLVLVWGDVTLEDSQLRIGGTKSSIQDFVKKVQNGEQHNLLKKDLCDLDPKQIPRYYMQVRHGSKFSKPKVVRIYSYFADAILFPDGVLWRDA